VIAARDLAQRHPGWRYVELPGVGHVPQLQVPERVAAEILSWLPRTAATGAGATQS
jgi:pimeloyl-ACP methyl ester carboxylesterase